MDNKSDISSCNSRKPKHKKGKKQIKKRSRSRDRDKDRERKRSRSHNKKRERDRSYSDKRKRREDKKKAKRNSRSRSRSVEKKKKRSDSKTDVETKEKPEIKPVASKGKSNFSEIIEYDDPMQTAANTGMLCLAGLGGAQNAKVDRKLYVGNLPTGITSSSLVQLLNQEMIKIKANTKPGDPVLSAWISTDSHYAFVEFRTAEEANNGFSLNSISILGQPLKVGRPKTYTGSFSMMEDGSVPNTVGAALQAGTMCAPQIGTQVYFPSRILCFKNLLKEINLDDEEQFKDIIQDIKEECQKYGRVASVFIPRKDVDDNPPGYGNAYIEFNTVEETKDTRKQMVGRKFNSRTVNMTYFPEDKYMNKDFSLTY